MKNIVYSLAFLCMSAVVMTSCNDDFLDRSPITDISDGNYWNTPNDLRLYCNNYYSRSGLLPYYDGSSQGWVREDYANGADTDAGVDYNRRMNGEGTVPSSGGGWAYGDWGYLRDLNYFMDHYKKVTGDQSQINQYVGETLFFRALFYFNKLKDFGDLPWITTTVGIHDNDILYAPRLSRSTIVDNIMTDLDQAVECLAARGKGAYTGRVTKEAALALQSRIALYEGTWEKYHSLKATPFAVSGEDGTRFLQKAVEAAEKLMAMADKEGYPALDNIGVNNGYFSLFNQRDYSNSKEAIFWRQYDGVYMYHTWQRYTWAGGGHGVTKSMVDSYLCTDGKPIGVSTLYKGDKTLKDVVTNRDPRLNQSIRVNDGAHVVWTDTDPITVFNFPHFASSSAENTSTGYELQKGHGQRQAEYDSNRGTNGIIYIRYAEVLLNYAEAKAELGQFTQENCDKSINKIRSRVSMPKLYVDNVIADPNKEFKNVSNLINEIRRERKVELLAEGFRVQDIFRWAAADEVICGLRPVGVYRAQWTNASGLSNADKTAINNLKVDANGYIDPYAGYPAMSNGYQFNLGRDYLKPLPTDQLVLNPQIKQNPGW